MPDPDLDGVGLGVYLRALSDEVDDGVGERPVATVRPRRRRWVAAVAAAVALVVGFVVFTGDDLANDVDTVGPTESTTTAVDPDESSLGPPVDGEWRELDDLLRARDSHAELLWTGDELIGVYPENGGNDVAIQIWDENLENPRLGAPSGQPWRAFPTIVWTGSDVLVIGGSNGPGIEDPVLVYDPASDTWRTGSPPPGFEPGSETGIGETGFWNGAEVLLTREALAYDPDADSWRPLASSPVPAVIAVAGTPTGAFHWGHCPEVDTEDPCSAAGPTVDGGALYSTADDAWSVLPSGDGPGSVAEMLTATINGDVAIVPVRRHPGEPEASAGVLDTRSGTWTTLPDTPVHLRGLSELLASPLGVVYGGSNVETTVLRPGSERWEPLGRDALTFNGGALGLAGDRVVVTGIDRTLVFEPGRPLSCDALESTAPVVGRLVVRALPEGFVARDPVEQNTTGAPIDDDVVTTWTQRFIDSDDRLISVADVDTSDPFTLIHEVHGDAAIDSEALEYCVYFSADAAKIATVSTDDAGTVVAAQTGQSRAFIVRGDASVTRDEVLLVAGGLRDT